MNFNKPTTINHIREDLPAFRILSERGWYGPDDTLYPEGSEIYLKDGSYPNEEMEPLNELGRQRLIAFFDFLDEEARRVAALTGKSFAGRPRNIDGGLDMATAVARAEMNIFGKPRNEDAVEKVSKDDTAVTGNVNPHKRGRGRPRKGEMAA